MGLADNAQVQVKQGSQTGFGKNLRHGHQEFGERQADRYYEALIRRFAEIANEPFKYQAVDHIRKDYRRSLCGVDSIYYRINGDIVEIMRILGRQDFNEIT